MERLLDLSLNDFLNRVAARQAVPGGGAVAGLVGALAAALARMVAEYSISAKTDPQRAAVIRLLAEPLGECERAMRDSIDADARAYAELSAVPADSPKRAEAIRNAIAVPQDVVRQVHRVLEILDQLKDVAKASMLSDLGAAAGLAEAAARAAEYMVRVNTAELSDADEADRILAETMDLLTAATDKLAAIEEHLIDHM